MMLKNTMPADICLILEGTYPYVSGGVSNWTHELIKMQQHLTFHIVALVGMQANTNLCFTLPDNVTGLTTVYLQKLPKAVARLAAKQQTSLFNALKKPLLNLQQKGTLDDLEAIINALQPFKATLGQELLFNSTHAWDLLVSMYNLTMPDSIFLDYFWSWRTLIGGLYSVLLAPLPEARIYHALCTGYAGLLLARARLQTGKPCLITEHGIYTNERRIEIAAADWLQDQRSLSLAINSSSFARELKDFWIDTFSSYSRLCYQASSQIITLYKGNQAFQLMDGADSSKLRVIPNGIDYNHFSAIPRDTNHPPTIALIGRVVPIKDVKSFIRATEILQHALPALRAFIIGPTDEDKHYYSECLEMVRYAGLDNILRFTGKVQVEHYLPQIDIIVLTSISEAQPLVILEAGAAAIPTVATDVGACREMIMGREDEYPPLGPGGAITPLANPRMVAEALLHLFSDKDYYHRVSQAIQQRVQHYYNKEQQYDAYKALYEMVDGRW